MHYTRRQGSSCNNLIKLILKSILCKRNNTHFCLARKCLLVFIDPQWSLISGVSYQKGYMPQKTFYMNISTKMRHLTFLYVY